jgi:hypothetical protein
MNDLETEVARLRVENARLAALLERLGDYRNIEQRLKAHDRVR